MLFFPLLGAAVIGLAQSPPDAKLDPHLEAFRPLLGRTYKGVFKKSTPENPIIDITRWERALNGRAVRFVHSVNDGAYGGETLFRWDPEEKAVTSHYFTTASFMTTGTVDVADGTLLFHDKVIGQAGDTVSVEATISINKDGSYLVRSDAISASGEKSPRETVYKPDNQAKVIFK